jgi:hypothetical protein
VLTDGEWLEADKVRFQIYRRAEEMEEAGPGAGCGGARLGLTTQLAVNGWSSDLGLRQSGRRGEARFGGRRERARRRLGSMRRKEEQQLGLRGTLAEESSIYYECDPNHWILIDGHR